MIALFDCFIYIVVDFVVMFSNLLSYDVLWVFSSTQNDQLELVMHRSWFFVADSDTDFFRANWPIPIPIPIFFPLSNQQEIMKDSNTNKVVI